NIFLDEPVRQALDNPIVYLANEVRQGRDISLGRFSDNVFILTPEQIDNSFLELSDQILVSYNKSAQSINNRYRNEILKRESHLPTVGDKIMALQNNWKKVIQENNIDQYLTNGLIGHIDRMGKNMENLKASKIDFRPEFFDDTKFKDILMDN